MHRDPIVPAEAGLRFTVGLHLYFLFLPSYQCQHRKLGAKAGAVLLNYNKKPCQAWGSLGTAQVPSGTHAPAPGSPLGLPASWSMGRSPLWVPKPLGWQGTGLEELFLTLRTPLGPFPHQRHKWGSPRPGSATRRRAARASPPAGPDTGRALPGSPPEPKY